MSDITNNTAENKPEDAQATENAREEKIENTGNSIENCANAQECSALQKPSVDIKKENENSVLPIKSEPSAKYSVHKTNFEKDTIYLYQFSRTPLLPSLSPYCLKVETWLRLAGLKYEVCM